MTQTTTTLDRVKNYQGQNSFVNKMKTVIVKYNGLTPNQLEAVEKCLNAVAEVKTEEASAEIKVILDYTGENSFVKDIASKFQKYGTLTQKQIEAATKQIVKEHDEEKTIRMKWNTPGETIVLCRKIGVELKEKYNLKFNPILIDITKLLAVSPKAIQFEGKMTVNRGKVCCVCNKTLTDELSMLSGVGKTCSSHLGVPYLTDKSQSEQYRKDYLDKIEKIGTMIFWIPKKQIKKWDGITQMMVNTMV